jgi:hypothetical protein
MKPTAAHTEYCVLKWAEREREIDKREMCIIANRRKEALRKALS